MTSTGFDSISTDSYLRTALSISGFDSISSEAIYTSDPQTGFDSISIDSYYYPEKQLTGFDSISSDINYTKASSRLLAFDSKWKIPQIKNSETNQVYSLDQMKIWNGSAWIPVLRD